MNEQLAHGGFPGVPYSYVEESDGQLVQVDNGVGRYPGDSSLVGNRNPQVAPFSDVNVWAAGLDSSGLDSSPETIQGPQNPQLTEGEMRLALDAAGFAGRRFDEALAISFCESSMGTRFWHTDKRGDGGIAYGPFQIHWFPEDAWEGWGTPALRAGYITEAEYWTPEDPVVNAKVGRYIVDTRGHWGGTGGWKTCAENAGVE